MATNCSCDFEYMEYINEDSIDPNLTCAICTKPLKDPVSTPCDHTYGRGCIEHWLTSSVNYSCPTCQKQPLLTTQLTQASRPLRNMLDQLRVRCTLCGQTDLQRGNFLDHVNKVCAKATVECRAADIKCPWKGLRDEKEDHVSTCNFEPLRPVLEVLIKENKQLSDRVHQHDKEIKKLTEKMSQIDTKEEHDSDEESDTSSVSGLSISSNAVIPMENAIHIEGLPINVTYNDLFNVFSKAGRIEYDARSQKPTMRLIKNPEQKSGFCKAKIVYVDKSSVTAAIAEFNNKVTAPWNTRLQVSIYIYQEMYAKGSRRVSHGPAESEHVVKKGQNTSNITEQASPPPELIPKAPMKYKARRRPK